MQSVVVVARRRAVGRRTGLWPALQTSVVQSVVVVARSPCSSSGTRPVAGLHAVGRAGVAVVARAPCCASGTGRSPGCRSRSCRRCCRCSVAVRRCSHRCPSPGCRPRSCRALLSVQGIGGKLHAALPGRRRIADVGGAEVVVVADDDRRALRRVRRDARRVVRRVVRDAAGVLRRRRHEARSRCPARRIEYGMSALGMKSSRRSRTALGRVGAADTRHVGADRVHDAVRRREAEGAHRERADVVAVLRLLQRAPCS